MTFSHTQITHIPRTLSEERFETYLRHSGNDKVSALKLYQWNLEISSALIIPLHFLEVSLRNAVVDTLNEVHTPNWPWMEGFIRSLPSPAKGYNPTNDLKKATSRQVTSGKVVAELKIIFWEKMFTVRHDKKLWNQHFYKAFPYTPQSNEVSDLRKRLHDDIAEIRVLRNRIAHHEPIFTRNILNDYTKIRTLVSWRDTVTAEWMDSLEMVTRLISQKPQ